MEDADCGKTPHRVLRTPTIRPMLELQDIRDAAARLKGHLLDTPCVESRTLSDIAGAQVS